MNHCIAELMRLTTVQVKSILHNEKRSPYFRHFVHQKRIFIYYVNSFLRFIQQYSIEIGFRKKWKFILAGLPSQSVKVLLQVADLFLFSIVQLCKILSRREINRSSLSITITYTKFPGDKLLTQLKSIKNNNNIYQVVELIYEMEE